MMTLPLHVMPLPVVLMMLMVLPLKLLFQFIKLKLMIIMLPLMHPLTMLNTNTPKFYPQLIMHHMKTTLQILMLPLKKPPFLPLKKSLKIVFHHMKKNNLFMKLKPITILLLLPYLKVKSSKLSVPDATVVKPDAEDVMEDAKEEPKEDAKEDAKLDAKEDHKEDALRDVATEDAPTTATMAAGHHSAVKLNP